MSLSQKLKKELGKNLKFNEPLRKWTTFRIGGPARYFFIAETIDDLVKAIKIAQQFKIPYFILGGGSNLLFSDSGFDGLVIKISILSVDFVYSADKQNCKVIVGAGVKLIHLVMDSVKFGLTGLEWAVGIPGSVGGAVYQNAGAFNSDFSRSVQSVMVSKNNKIKKLNKKQCGFAYRTSIFQKNKDIILSVELKLKKGDKKKSQEKIKEIINYRRARQPLQPSAGSVFKNVSFKKIKPTLLKKYPQLQKFKDNGIIPTGWLIENTGLKGIKIGGAQISEKHANFIINKKGAKAKDVFKLIEKTKNRIRKRFGIEIKEEIEKIN